MRKIKTLLTLTITLVLVVVIITTNIIASNIDRVAIEEESKRLLKTSTAKVALEVENKLQKFEQQIETLKNNIRIHYDTIQGDHEFKMHHILDDFDEIIENLNEMNIEAIASYLVFHYEIYPESAGDEFIYQVVFSKNKNGVNNRNYNLGNQDSLKSKIPEMAWYYRPLEQRKGVWSNIYYDTYLEESIITYSTPIIIQDELIGVVGIDIKFSDFEKIITDIQVYETGYAFLFNDDFDYLVHPDYDVKHNLTTIESGEYAYMKPLFEADTNGSIYYTYKGKDKVLSYEHLHNNWIIALAPPYDEVYYFYNDLRTTQLNFMLISSVFALLLAYILGHFISQPITSLASAIKGVSSDTFENIHFKNNYFIYEVDVLQKNFNFFLTRLQEAFLTIREQNANLEAIINERTNDLTQSNQQLKETIHQLKTTQDLLVKAQKEQEINLLIKNIAHNLNTPLGTAIMTHDYLTQQLKSNTSKKITHTLNMVSQNLIDIKAIIDGLNLLTADHKHSKMSVLSLETVIQDRTHQLVTQHPEMNIQINFNASDTHLITSNTKMLASLLDLIFTFGTKQTKHNLSMDIHITENADHYLIEIKDYQTSFSHMTMFKEQANLAEMAMSQFDLNLHLIHAVIQALKGHISYKKTEDKHLQWIIQLPKIS